MNTAEQNYKELYFNGQLIRFIKTTEALMLIAVDLLSALELSPSTSMKIPDEFKGLGSIQKDKNGQLYLWKHQVLTVKQDGLLDVLCLANRKTALQFQKWYYEVALPSIWGTDSTSA